MSFRFDTINDDIDSNIRSCIADKNITLSTNCVNNKDYKCNREKNKVKKTNEYNKHLCEYQELISYYNDNKDTPKLKEYLKDLVNKMNDFSSDYLDNNIQDESISKSDTNSKNMLINSNSSILKNQNDYIRKESNFNIKMDQVLDDDDVDLNRETTRYNVYIFLNVLLITILFMLLLFRMFYT